MFVVERLRQHARKPVEAADEQLVLQHADGRGADQLRDAGDGARLRHDQRIDRRADALQIGDEVEARRALHQLRDRHLVIGLVGVAAVDAAPADLSDLRFEIDDRLGALRGIGLAGEREHLGQVRLIGGLLLGVLLLEVIVAIGQAETRLAHLDDIGFGRLIVLADAAAKRNRDAVTVSLREQRGVIRLGRAFDRVEPRLDRREALRLDRAGVEIGGVGRADLGARLLGRGLQDAPGAIARQIGERVEGAEARLIGGDGGRLRPGAVGVVVEIVARRDAAVHARFVEAEGADLRFARCGSGRRLLRINGAGKRRSAEQAGDEIVFHGLSPMGRSAVQITTEYVSFRSP